MYVTILATILSGSSIWWELMRNTLGEVVMLLKDSSYSLLWKLISWAMNVRFGFTTALFVVRKVSASF